jgi:predicted N-acetyltransferase YhbS
MRNDLPKDVVTIGPAEGEPLENLLPLWTEVFDKPAEVFTGVWAACPPERRHTFLARTESRPVASVQLYVLPLRTEAGEREWVGCIANVATLPDYRKRGLAGQLIEHAIARMEAVGCGWSYLFTGVPDFYARYGWRPYERSALQFDSGPTREARLLSREDLPAVQALHERFHSATPLSQVRSEGDWADKIPPRVPDRRMIGLGDPLTAYASAVLWDPENPTLDEWAAGTTQEYADLLAAMRGLQGVKGVQVAAPITDVSRPALAGGRSTTLSVGMARPVAGAWTDARLQALLTSPEARFFTLDNF